MYEQVSISAPFFFSLANYVSQDFLANHKVQWFCTKVIVISHPMLIGNQAICLVLANSVSSLSKKLKICLQHANVSITFKLLMLVTPALHF